MQIDESTFFREVTLRICGSLDVDQALSSVFEYLRTLMPVDAMGLGYFEISTGSIRIVAQAQQTGANSIWDEGASEIFLPPSIIAELSAQTVDTVPVYTSNRPEDLTQDTWLQVFPGLAQSSALFLELHISGQEIGVLTVSAAGLDRYTEQEAALMSLVSEPFAIAMSNARRYGEIKRMRDLLAEDNRALSADIKRAVGVEVVGADFGLKEVMEQVRQIARSNSPCLLLGETGTGKEVIAHAIHMASQRSKGPMISMQCGAVPDTLLDSELFGHEKGAFTGASDRKRGRFERANRGTLFLDEIGELSPDAQVKLLRILQEKRFERVGGTQTVEVDVRVIAATHRDLEQMVRRGTFREDLWYRLNVLPIRIPPLRLRREDVPSLVHYFVERKAQEMNLLHIPKIDSHTMNRLKAYAWPGNVRELQNVIERALILSRGDTLEFPDFVTGHHPPPSGASPAFGEAILSMDQATKRHIEYVLVRVGGRIKGKGGAAEVLQINPSTLRFRMKKLGITKSTAASLVDSR